MPYDQNKVNNFLKKEDKSKFESAVTTELVNYVKQSSTKMADYWEIWEKADKSYRGFIVPNKQDAVDSSNGQPTRVLVPLTYAQIQTAVSFIFATFSQKDKFFELVGSGPEDVAVSDALETDINYQFNKAKGLIHLYLYVLDTIKYGLGVQKITWEEEKCFMRVAKEETVAPSVTDSIKGFFGAKIEPKTQIVETVAEVLKYQGNKIRNVSPFNFLPDPNFPIARFQEGSFCAFEEVVSRDCVNAGEGKIYFGTKWIEPLKQDITEGTERRRWSKLLLNEGKESTSDSRVDRSSYIFTEIQFTLTPSEWTEKFKDEGLDFGDETYPMKFVAVIVNDSKLIRFEKLGYLHDQYTYVVSEYLPDHSAFVSHGLADTISGLQDLYTWFYNSHVANVKKNINNQFIVDPEKVELDDLKNNRQYIRVKTKVGGDFKSAIEQVKVTDVTAGHVADSASLFQTMQTITGVNDNAIGQYATGRRSAFESRQVNQGAAMRLRMHATIMWNNGIEPSGQQMLANTRQNRTKDVYTQIVGPVTAEKAPYEQAILADPQRIAGGYDFAPYDGTLPSEKNSQAQILQELFTTVVGSPVGMQLGVDPRKLLYRIGQLTGIKDLDNVASAPFPAPTPMTGAPQVPGAPPIPGQAPQAPPQVQVVPDDQLAQQAQQQGGIPVQMNAAEQALRAFTGQQ